MKQKLSVNHTCHTLQIHETVKLTHDYTWGSQLDFWLFGHFLTYHQIDTIRDHNLN